MIAIIAVLCSLSSPANCHVEQDHGRTREGLQPASARGHRLTDRRRLTRLWKRLPAQARPVIPARITQSYRRRLLLSTNLNQINRRNASAMHKIVQVASGILSSIKRKQGFCCLRGVTFQSLTRLTGISH
jgi:hypothetical protein